MIIFFKKNHLKIKNKQSFVGGQGHVCFCVVLKQEYSIILVNLNSTHLIIILKSLNPNTTNIFLYFVRKTIIIIIRIYILLKFYFIITTLIKLLMV